jgi:uncharacterized membrane protein HdeD (DUF308 family)
MTAPLTNDIADRLGRIGRHWGLLLVFGILTLAAGAAAVAWPGAAVLFGVQLVVSGVFQFIGAFGHDEGSGGMRVLSALLGLLALVVGLYAVRHVLVSVLALALLLGIFWVVSGFIQLFGALSHQGLPHRGWIGFTGVLSVLTGLVVLVYPGISLVTLAFVLGFWLIVYGFMEIGLAFRVRSAGKLLHA